MRQKYDTAESIYTKLLERKEIDPTLVCKACKTCQTCISVLLSPQVYVQYMKFSRRSSGIKAARNVFKKAREDPRSAYHVGHGDDGKGSLWKQTTMCGRGSKSPDFMVKGR